MPSSTPRKTPKEGTVEESLFITELKVDLMQQNKGMSSETAEREAWRIVAIRREKGI